MRYDYRCPSCLYVDEIKHGMSEKPVILCPICDTQMTRYFTAAVPVVYKGSGYATNDLRTIRTASDVHG